MKQFILSLLFCSLEMSAVSIVYLCLLKVLKNRQLPVLRYYSWVAILVGFLMPIKPSFGKAAVVLNEPKAAYLHQPANAAAAQPAISIYQILLIVWLTVALLYLTVSLFRYKSFRKSISRLSKRADARTINIAVDLAKALGITAPVKVVIVREIATPMMTGLLAPTILLPERAFADSELRLILKHELTHFKHRDLWVKLLLLLCRAVHWFDPILILISRSIEQECEHYCDHSVITGENAEQKKLYCQSILNTVSAQNSFSKRGLRPVMATNFYTPKRGLKHRLGLILSSRRKKAFTFVGIAAAVLTAISGSAVAFADNTEISAKNDSFKITTTTANREGNVANTQTYDNTDTAPKPENTEPVEVTTSIVTTEAQGLPAVMPEGEIITVAPEDMQGESDSVLTSPYYSGDSDNTVVTTAPTETHRYAETTTVTYIIR